VLKRIAVWGVVAVAAVVAVQVLHREGPPRSLFVPPSLKLPAAVDDLTERASRQQAQPAAPEDGEEAAAAELALPTAAPVEVPAAADGSRRSIFDCGNGVLFSVRAVPGEVTVFSPHALGGEVITLPQVTAASGTRYAEGGVSYWNFGALATFELRERTFADCTSSSRAAQAADARRRGVTFRARGNEPSWLLDISYERIGIALDLGTRRIEFPHRMPTISGTRATYRTFSGTQQLDVVIDGIPCNDSMSGERFEATVTVTFESGTFYGCGEPL
jgi:putative lipoprotein